MAFRTDDRAVSEVIGAVLVFGILIIAFSTFQAYSIPNQNSGIEANHYQAVQNDLTQLQSTIVTAGDTGGARSTTVDLGPTYPSRLFGVNAGPPSGQLRAVSVGSGELQSSDVPLDETCRLQAGGPDAVPTKALVYTPGYNYYRGGDVPHRLEETLLYQSATDSGSAVARTDQSMVDVTGRSVTLYPLQSELQSSGTGSETYRFVGGYGSSTTVSGPASITIPTKAPVSLWEEQVAAGNPDISVSDSGPDSVSITFDGQWEFNCRPVAQGGSPDQIPLAEAGPDRSVAEGESIELDGSNSQASGAITGYSWTFSGSPPTGVALNDGDTATPVIDASGADVASDTQVDVQLTVTEGDGDTDTDSATITIENTDTSAPTPSITGTADNLPTGSTGTTQEITFSPTESTIPGDEVVTIDLSGPDGGTSDSPDPVHYGEGSISIDYNSGNSDINIISNSNEYIIEWTPNTNVPTSETVSVEITNVKTQSDPVSGLEVVLSRSDGGSSTPTFDLTDGSSSGPTQFNSPTITSKGGGNSGYTVDYNIEDPNGLKSIKFELVDTGANGVLDTYTPTVSGTSADDITEALQPGGSTQGTEDLIRITVTDSDNNVEIREYSL